MKNTNLALITALYNTKDADFYTDIYFPIVKFSAMEIYYNSNSTEKYYDITSLQNEINKKIGITIPILVLNNCIRNFAKSNTDVYLELYEKGNYFKIKQAWDIEENQSIEDRASNIEQEFENLETQFKDYLKINKLDYEHSFIDFFSKYAEEAYSFISLSNQTNFVDESYVNLVRFIEYIKEKNFKLYNLILDVTWSSIISGFLQRPQNEIGTNIVEKVDYYLDTTLILSILNLNSDENISYANDLLTIITDSGGLPKIHPITIREIKQIFEQIEISQGPKHGSTVEIAWIRDNLTLSSITHLKNNLLEKLKGKGVVQIYNNSKELDDNIEKYKKNSYVLELRKKRNSFNGDCFRDIHDIYMHDYVAKLNGKDEFIEKQKACFVTMNVDLLELYKEEKTKSVIHPGKIIMSLWIHGSRGSKIKKSILIEVMSRCFAMNQTSARHKISVFNNYYKNNDLTEEDIQNMYTSLIKRSSKTINKFDELIATSFSEQQDENETIKITKAIIEISREEKNIQIKSYENKIDEKNKENENLKRIVKLQREEKELRPKFNALIVSRDRSIRYTKFYIVLISEIVSILILIGSISCTIYNLLNKPDFSFLNIFSLGIVTPIISHCWRIKDLYLFNCNSSKLKIKEEQVKVWMDKHPEYEDIKSKIDNLESQIKSINIE